MGWVEGKKRGRHTLCVSPPSPRHQWKVGSASSSARPLRSGQEQVVVVRPWLTTGRFAREIANLALGRKWKFGVPKRSRKAHALIHVHFVEKARVSRPIRGDQTSLRQAVS